MLISELARQTSVSAQTIRYYESIGLMTRPKRAGNNYRDYTPTDVERLRFIASARSLGFTLADIREILTVRDGGQAPCVQVLETLDHRLQELDRRIASLVALRDTLSQLRHEGAALPLDDVRGERCVCYLLKTYHESGQITIERKELGV
jgi:DNA-binding transcriptional MerR regulator